jgi:hypothetical protein
MLKNQSRFWKPFTFLCLFFDIVICSRNYLFLKLLKIFALLNNFHLNFKFILFILFYSDHLEGIDSAQPFLLLLLMLEAYLLFSVKPVKVKLKSCSLLLLRYCPKSRRTDEVMVPESARIQVTAGQNNSYRLNHQFNPNNSKG